MAQGMILPTPGQLAAGRQASCPAKAPVLPTQWRAQVLLTPFGDMNPPMANYSQLVVADVTYDYTNYRFMRVSLYLTQDLKYYDFLFLDGRGWYWLVSEPGGPITDYFGPFATPLQVPPPDFLTKLGGHFGNRWPIMGLACDGWVVPTSNGGQEPDHGSWYSFRGDRDELYRIFTFDSDNPCRIPILGSYYLANVAAFVPGSAPDAVHQVLQTIMGNDAGRVEEYSNILLTQQDVQRAMADPLAVAPCTPQQIEKLIPGFAVAPGGALPEWTDRTYIEGWTIGSDFIPYYTIVYYWYTYGRQQTIFIGLGLNPGHGDYNDRQDSCLYTDHADPSKDYTDVPQYHWASNGWVPNCCAGKIPGIGVPRPDWVSADGGQIVASITGNPNFGLGPDEVLNLISCPLERGPGELALFWVWFTDQAKGVLFTEANFLNSTDHSLQLVDYERFERNAEWITSDIFSDPCPDLQACPAATALTRRPDWARVIGPRTLTCPTVAHTTGAELMNDV